MQACSFQGILCLWYSSADISIIRAGHIGKPVPFIFNHLFYEGVLYTDYISIGKSKKGPYGAGNFKTYVTPPTVFIQSKPNFMINKAVSHKGYIKL